MRSPSGKWIPPHEYLSLLIHSRYYKVEQFVIVFNNDDYMANVQLSKSTLDSLLCGRRKLSGCSAAVVWKMASVLCGHSSERDLYEIMCGFMHGKYFGLEVDYYED